jgi:hypothetical protein
MAYSPNSRLEYAVKFFIARDAFEQERALYCGHNPLGRFLPQVFVLSAFCYAFGQLRGSVVRGCMPFRSWSYGLDEVCGSKLLFGSVYTWRDAGEEGSIVPVM